MKDRGLTPSFEDVIEGLERARLGETDRSKIARHIDEEVIDTERAVQYIEDSCRRRMKEITKEAVLTWMKATFDTMARDKNGEPIQCQNSGSDKI